MDRASGPLHGLVLNAGVGAVVALVLLAQRRLGELSDVRKAPVAFVDNFKKLSYARLHR